MFIYMVIDNIGVELLVVMLFCYKIGIWVIGDIVIVYYLLLILMVQWYFGDVSSKFCFYVGVGINYIIFFDNGFNDYGKEVGFFDFSLKDFWGAVGQVGVDYLINCDWLVNMLVWYMDIDIIVNYKLGGVQ